MPDRSDTPSSREILKRISKIDVRQQGGGQQGVKTVRQPHLRRSIETVRPWSLLDVIVIAVTLLVAGVVSSLILGNRLTNLLPAVGVVWVRITLLLVFYAIELGVLALLAYRRKLSFAAAFRLYHLSEEECAEIKQSDQGRKESQSAHPLSVGQVVIAVIGLSILLRLAAFGWTLWVAPLLHWATPKAGSMTFLFGKTGLGAVAAVLIVAILGPFIEELAFRVIIQEWFAARLPILLTALITSAIFAGSHFSLWALPLNLLLGFATSWLAYKSKTIWPAAVLHALYNATVILAAFYLLLVTP